MSNQRSREATCKGVLGAVVLLALLACGGCADEDERTTHQASSTTPAATVAATLGPAPGAATPVGPGNAPETGHPPGTRTGIASVNVLVEAFIAQDIERLLALARYELAPCTTMADGYGPPPMCPPGVAAGTPVEFMTTSGCHGVMRTRDDLHYGLRMAGQDIRLYAVARATRRPDARAEHVVFFSVQTQTGGPWGMAFETGADGFIHQDGGCGFSPDFMLERYALDDLVLPPP